MTENSESTETAGTDVAERVAPTTKVTSWDEAMASGEVATIASTVLVDSDEDLAALEKCPFMVTHLAFRRGYPLAVPGRADLVVGAYVSMTCLMAPDDKGGKTLPVSGVAPGEEFVINDGGTGAYRQMVAYLANRRIITLPEGADSGKRGESVYDLPPSEWADIAEGVGEVFSDDDGFENYHVAIPPLLARRGVRTSTYPNPVNPRENSTTIYFQ